MSQTIYTTAFEDEPLSQVDMRRDSTEEMHDTECDFVEEEEEEEEESDSEEDQLEGGRVALAYDPSQLTQSEGFPQNGHDYLKLVQTERVKYPAISYSSKQFPNNTNKLKDNDKKEQLELEGESSEVKKSDSADKTIADYDDLQVLNSKEIVKNFKTLRQEIEQIRATLVQPTNQQGSSAKLLITSESIENNYNGCDDDVSGCGDDGKRIRQLREKQMKKSERRANHLLKLIELGYPPEVTTLLQQDQLDLHLTLESLVNQGEIMSNYSTIPNDWVYSIMAALREPIEPDICSTLRKLARLCISTRDRYNNAKRERRASGGSGISNAKPTISAKQYASSLLIICIVHYYFGQTDLK